MVRKNFVKIFASNITSKSFMLFALVLGTLLFGFGGVQPTLKTLRR